MVRAAATPENTNHDKLDSRFYNVHDIINTVEYPCILAIVYVTAHVFTTIDYIQLKLPIFLSVENK